MLALIKETLKHSPTLKSAIHIVYSIVISNKKNSLSNKLEIFNLLKRIQKSKCFISLSLPALPQCGLTTLLDIHHDAQVLVFDEANPSIHAQTLNAKKELECSLKLEQLPVIFTAKFLEHKKNNLIYTHFPGSIYYPQNRRHYRLHAKADKSINATIFLSPTKKLNAEVINISLEGICVRLPFAFAKFFSLTQIIEDIYIELSEKNDFSVSACIKSLSIEKSYQHILIGLQFDQHNTRIEKIIQQYIFKTDNINSVI